MVPDPHGRQQDLRPRTEAPGGPDLALMGGEQRVVDEERLTRRAATPVFGARFVPDRGGTAEDAVRKVPAHLIVGLAVVDRVVAGRAQELRERLPVCRRHHGVAAMAGAHVTRTPTVLMDAHDDRGSAGRANARRGERACVARALAGQAIDAGRVGNGVAVGAQPGAQVLGHDQQDVGPLGAPSRERRGQKKDGQQPSQPQPRHPRSLPRVSPARATASRSWPLAGRLTITPSTPTSNTRV